MRALRSRLFCLALVLVQWRCTNSDPSAVDRTPEDASAEGPDADVPAPLWEPAADDLTNLTKRRRSAGAGNASLDSCTGLYGDPWATGKLTPCCGTLQKCLGQHGTSGSHLVYRCLSNCPCTTEDRDPYAKGVLRGCCADLQQCLGRHHTYKKLFYKCLTKCPVLVGTGWCQGEEPEADFSMRQDCDNSTEVKVLTYNLFWWNLFKRYHGRNASAGKLIAQSGPFDIMGFQECEDVWRVLRDGGIAGLYDVVVGPGATAIAYDNSTWELLDKGESYIAEDQKRQYFGKRSVQWARLQHIASNKTVFAANHHGPLPVNTGGVCGPQATAFNLLSVIRANAQEDDVKVVLGDFNADWRSKTQHALMGYLNRIAHFWVDAVFSSCPYRRAWRLGRGGSDHQAITATFAM